MADIIDFESVKRARADEALEVGKGAYQSVLVLGWDLNDDLLVIWGGEMSDPDIVFLLELVKLNILQGDL